MYNNDYSKIVVGVVGEDIMKELIGSGLILLFTIFSLSANAAPGDLFTQVNLNQEMGPVNCSILKTAPNGDLAEFVSSDQIKNLTGEDAADCDNSGLAIEDNGNVYFNEDESDNIFKVTPEGVLSIFITEAEITALTGLANADLDNGMTIGLDGNLYFADEEGFVLRATLPDGDLSLVLTEAEILAVTGKDEADLQGGIAFDCEGNLYITDEEGGNDINDVILKLTPGGFLSIFITEADILAVTGGSSVDLDVGMNFFVETLYVLDDGECDCVLKIDTEGNIEEFITEEDIEAVTGGNADLEGGIAISQFEVLFIGDDGNDPNNPNILQVTPDGIVSIFVSTDELEDFYPGFEPRLQGSMAIEGVDSCFRLTIPTLSEWGLIAMASILGIVGFMVLRRKRITA